MKLSRQAHQRFIQGFLAEHAAGDRETVLPQGIAHAERAAAERTISRRIDAQAVQTTMFTEAQQQPELF